MVINIKVGKKFFAGFMFSNVPAAKGVLVTSIAADARSFENHEQATLYRHEIRRLCPKSQVYTTLS